MYRLTTDESTTTVLRTIAASSLLLCIAFLLTKNSSDSLGTFAHTTQSNQVLARSGRVNYIGTAQRLSKALAVHQHEVAGADETLPKSSLEVLNFHRQSLGAIVAPFLALAGGLAFAFSRRHQHSAASEVPPYFHMAGTAEESSWWKQLTKVPDTEEWKEALEKEDTDLGLEKLRPSDMELMYINALWSYYAEGKAILTDEQFSSLKMELNWQGSGFPALRRDEVEFVKAVLAYAEGKPILSDEEYDALKQKIESSGRRKDVTAFLVIVKGKELLSPENYNKLQRSMRAAGLEPTRENIASSTLSDTPNTLQYQVLEVLYMYSVLSLVPSALCASAWGFLGFIMGGLSGVGTVITAGFPVVGASSFLLTRQMIRYLELTGPKLVKGVCPSCEAPIKASFFQELPAQKVEKCSNCGTLSTLDADKMILRDAAGFGFIGEDDAPANQVNQYLSWASGVTSGILVGQNPDSQLGGRKPDKSKKEEKPADIPEMLQKEIRAGIFAWAVLLGYAIFGETFVGRARGKGIALHSSAINDFCQRFNIPNGLRQKYIQTAKRNGHDLGFLVDGAGLIGDGLFGKQAMAWWKEQGF